MVSTTDESTDNAESLEILTIYTCMPYYSNKRLSVLKSFLSKIQSNNVKTHSIGLKTQYNANKIEFYCNTKDKTVVLCNVVYDFSCSNCGANYIGKTERTLYDRTVEHAWTDNNSAVNKNLNGCTGVQYWFDIASLHSQLFASSSPIQNSDKFDLGTSHIILVLNTTKIIDRHKDWIFFCLKRR